jgi:hypothetical protein
LTGENIGSIRGVPPSPDAAAEWFMNNWMNSPGHRENILNRGYTLWGVAVAARDKDIRAVQVFHEIWGMLDQPVPDVLPRSVPLNLGGVGATHWGPPREFDLVDAGGGVRGPWPTSGGRIDAPAGEYRLRFRFFIQEGTTLHYQIVPGPGVLVR